MAENPVDVKPFVGISSFNGLSTSIQLSGSVGSMDDNTVKCTLTDSAKPANTMMKSVPVSQQRGWMVEFTPSDLNELSFCGMYSFEASASMENPATATITVPAPPGMKCPKP
jgi:hypothetical protein